MGFLSKMFGKKTNEIKAKASKVENKDFMEAIVACSILVAYADGECEDSELAKLSDVVSSLPELEHFGGEIVTTISKYEQLMKAGFRLGKAKLMREIEDIKSSVEEKELVFITALTIAEADGEVEPQELVILKEIAQKLGINLRDYGIE